MDKEVLKVPRFVRYFHNINFPVKYGIMDRIFGKSLSKQGVCWYKLRSGKIWKLDMNMVTHRWIIYGSYDYPFIKWAKKNVPADGVVVDSGANIGQMTLYLGELAQDGKVLAFEPSTEAADWLADSIKANNSLNIELIRKGLGENETTAVLIDKAKESQQNLHAFWSYISERPSEHGEKILITNLVKEITIRNIEKVDLWKLDVEGFELPALKGAEELLIKKKIKAIYAELAIKENNNNKIVDFLSKYGYQCHFLDRNGNLLRSKEIPNHQTNGIFLSV